MEVETKPHPHVISGNTSPFVPLAKPRVRNQMAIPSLRTRYLSCLLARVFGLTHFLQLCDAVFGSTETGTEAQIRVLIHQDVLQ